MKLFTRHNSPSETNIYTFIKTAICFVCKLWTFWWLITISVVNRTYLPNQPGNTLHVGPQSGFVLLWAFEIPWLSMTFSMTSPSFPWPKFDHFHGNHLSFRVCFYYFLRTTPQFILYFLINTIFHDFPWPTPKFHDFPGLENEILKFHDFPDFPWPVRTLCNIDPCL